MALLALVSMALVTACGDDDDEVVPATEEATAAATPEATAEATAEPRAEDGRLEQLQANASAFGYQIGKRGGTLTSAILSDPLTFNLAIATDATSSGVVGYLFEGLTEVSWLTNEVEPGLAESWENSDDGLSWTFRLREDVRWHDGEPFTAQDVAFTFDRIIYNDDIPASSRPAFTFRYLNDEGAWEEAGMSVELIDDYTVRFVLPVPFAPFLRAMGTAIYPKHILEQAVSDGVFAETWGIETPPEEIIGTGPFTIETYEPGERVVLRRNPNYWLTDGEGEQLPYLDSLVHIIVPDIEAALAAFRAGETDVFGLPGRDYAEVYSFQQEENFTIHRRGPGFGTTFLTFNQNPGTNPETGEPYVAPEKLAWFQNAEFRRAVSHAINRDVIIEEAFDGLGYPQWGPISPSAGDFHNPEVRRYEYDPAAAMAAKAGGKAAATKRVASMISVGHLPLQGMKLLVRMAMSRSRGESMTRQATTPAALQPRPILMVSACLPWAPAFLNSASTLNATRGRYPRSSSMVKMGKNMAMGGSITAITQASPR